MVKLLKMAAATGNIDKACRSLGFGKGSYYLYRDLYEQGGEAALWTMLTKKKSGGRSRRTPPTRGEATETC